MCGRVVQARPLDELAEVYEAPPDEVAIGALRPRYNVAPTDPIAVVVQEDRRRRLTAQRWGLVPPGAGAEGDGGTRPGGNARARAAAPLINARAETIATNALFRAAFERRRCLVPVDGFYEWQRSADGRQPWFIRSPSAAPLTLAGIWLPWRNGPAGLLGSCSIVTRIPDEVVGRLHDRMPAILPRSAWEAWLAPDTSIDEAMAILDAGDPASRLEAYPVVRLVNSVRNDGPQLLARAEVQATLF